MENPFSKYNSLSMREGELELGRQLERTLNISILNKTYSQVIHILSPIIIAGLSNEDAVKETRKLAREYNE